MITMNKMRSSLTIVLFSSLVLNAFGMKKMTYEEQEKFIKRQNEEIKKLSEKIEKFKIKQPLNNQSNDSVITRSSCFQNDNKRPSPKKHEVLYRNFLKEMINHLKKNQLLEEAEDGTYLGFKPEIRNFYEGIPYDAVEKKDRCKFFMSLFYGLFKLIDQSKELAFVFNDNDKSGAVSAFVKNADKYKKNYLINFKYFPDENQKSTKKDSYVNFYTFPTNKFDNKNCNIIDISLNEKGWDKDIRKLYVNDGEDTEERKSYDGDQFELKYKRGTCFKLLDELDKKEFNSESFEKLLTKLFEQIPFKLRVKRENYYQMLFAMLLRLVRDRVVSTEVHNYKGRSDVVVETGNNITVIEFKHTKISVGKKPEQRLIKEALDQINDRGYSRMYVNQGKPIYNLAVVVMEKDDKFRVIVSRREEHKSRFSPLRKKK